MFQVESHGYCMTIMQVGIVACLRVKKAPRRSAEGSQKDSLETLLSRKGLVNGKGKMVIFGISKHGENDTNRMGSTKRRSGLWNHLIWSCGKKDMKVFCQGPICNKIITNRPLAEKTERALRSNTPLPRGSVFQAETERKYAFNKRKRTLSEGEQKYAFRKRELTRVLTLPLATRAEAGPGTRIADGRVPQGWGPSLIHLGWPGQRTKS